MKNIDSASVINVGRPLSALVACAWFSLFNVAHAVDSADTLPVHGRGAPSAPTLSVPPGFALRTAVTATVGQVTDPDGDPITYEVWWCTGTSRTGTCVTGTSQTFTTTTTRYVSARADTPRGFPTATQGKGAWSREVTTVYTDAVISGPKMFSKPLNTTTSHSGGIYRCNDLVSGGYSDWRLPTYPELLELYQRYPNNRVSTELGWPTSNVYWTSTEDSLAGTILPRYISLATGSTGLASSANFFVTCVRG